ncbi:uncharacterized protein LOC143246050 isoform X3 [Tachypleus tridentatus]|uniref:uncharacterized protein LOC143246050 isoform X3 n=1 Tax=Tachypleus tridentatus TaxID=6853 RepID=UPI003FCFAAD7
MDTSSVEFIDYYGYDMDHVEMFLDPKDSDFAPEFQSDSFEHKIRNSQSSTHLYRFLSTRPKMSANL